MDHRKSPNHRQYGSGCRRRNHCSIHVSSGRKSLHRTSPGFSTTRDEVPSNVAVAPNRNIPRHGPIVPIPPCRPSRSHRRKKKIQKSFQWRFHLAIVIMRDTECCRHADEKHRKKKESPRTEPMTRSVCSCMSKLPLNNASISRKYVKSILTQTCSACELCLNHQGVTVSTCLGHGSKSVKQTVEWSTRAPRGRHFRVKPGVPRISARVVGNTLQDQKIKIKESDEDEERTRLAIKVAHTDW